MNNQMPYLGGMNPSGMNPGNMNQNYMPNQNNYNDMMFERINNRLNRLERQVRMIENRLNMMGGNPTFLKNNQDTDDNMYML